MIQKVKAENPKVLMIGNFVTVKLCADGLCAMGAEPSMSFFEEETEEIVSQTDAVVINIGTPTEAKHGASVLAAQCAEAQKLPLILDIQGISLSKVRVEMVRELISSARFSVIKGNQTEIRTLYALLVCGESKDIAGIASALAKETESVILCSGAQDIITDGERTTIIKNGCPELALISGTGCLLGAVTGALAGSGLPAFEAALTAAALIAVCGERACLRIKKEGLGIGSMAVFLLDELYAADEALLEELRCDFKE